MTSPTATSNFLDVHPAKAVLQKSSTASNLSLASLEGSARGTPRKGSVRRSNSRFGLGASPMLRGSSVQALFSGLRTYTQKLNEKEESLKGLFEKFQGEMENTLSVKEMTRVTKYLGLSELTEEHIKLAIHRHCTLKRDFKVMKREFIEVLLDLRSMWERMQSITYDFTLLTSYSHLGAFSLCLDQESTRIIFQAERGGEYTTAEFDQFWLSIDNPDKGAELEEVIWWLLQDPSKVRRTPFPFREVPEHVRLRHLQALGDGAALQIDVSGHGLEENDDDDTGPPTPMSAGAADRSEREDIDIGQKAWTPTDTMVSRQLFANGPRESASSL